MAPTTDPWTVPWYNRLTNIRPWHGPWHRSWSTPWQCPWTTPWRRVSMAPHMANAMASSMVDAMDGPKNVDHPDLLQCLLNLIELELNIALGYNQIIHVIFEPRRRSPVISPYGTMAAVESTSVIIVAMHDCSGRIVLVGGLCGKVWSGPCHSPNWYTTNPDSVLSSLQNTGYF